MDSFWLDRGVKPASSIKLKYASLLDLIDDCVKKYASKIAFTNINHDLTYREIDELSQAFAAYLQSLKSLNQGDRIALMAPNILAFPVACLGILRAGFVLVNTNPLYTEAEMLHQLNDSGAKVLIIFSGMAYKAEKILAKTSVTQVIVVGLCDLHPWLTRNFYHFMFRHVAKMQPSFNLPDHVEFRDALTLGENLKPTYKRPNLPHEALAMLQYTGGTTGGSKGAMLTHGNLIANISQAQDVLGKLCRECEEIVVSPLPLYHIYSFTVAMMGMMVTGNRNILITNPRDIPRFVKILRRYPFTGIAGITTLFVALCENKDFRSLDFSNLRFTASGGMSLTKDAYDCWREVTGCDIVEGYGLTEASPIVSLNIEGFSHFGTIGKPIEGTEVRLVGDDGKDLPLGDPNAAGELWVRGPQVMLGYWQRTEETRNVLTADGWLKTGDIATIDKEGYMRIVDRKKDMIIVSGFNVYPNELEDVISQHPDILECAAIGVAHPKSGEVIKLFVVPKKPTLTQDEVLDYARKYLTNYKIPKFVEFRKELPKSPVGKILRRELRDAERSQHS